MCTTVSANADVSVLLRATERLDDLAAALRARAALIAAQTAATRWYSPASRAYFARIDDVTAELTGCAQRVSELADLARRHAALVRAHR